MPAEPPPITAHHLVAQMEQAGGDVLLAIGEQLAAMTRADLPVGDPQLDPDPGFALAEHVKVRRYGNFVSVAVEAPYAAEQHEAMHFRHPRGGRPKFLERNATALIAAFEGQLAVSIARQFTGGKGFETRL
jgi:hypothetical protein